MPIVFLLPVLALALCGAALPARADCIDDAAVRNRVNALVLRAIGWQESRLQPRALGRNANGSVDVGAFQINSIHLRELASLGISRQALADGCVSAEVAAWHYRRQVDLKGDTWLAVGAYHSRTTARATWYANQIAAILMRWKVMPPGPPPFPPDRTHAPDMPRAPRMPDSPDSPDSPARPREPLAPAISPRCDASCSAIAFLPPAR
jgi:hypothetical protein